VVRQRHRHRHSHRAWHGRLHRHGGVAPKSGNNDTFMAHRSPLWCISKLSLASTLFGSQVVCPLTMHGSQVV
jgi:hypothetical protein